jgi:recombination protein RecR
MLSLPRALADLIHRLQRLPGVGPRAAERMALALLAWSNEEAELLAAEIVAARRRVQACPQCGCLAQDSELCGVCADSSRDPALLCVVEGALDALALERGGSYRGRYHVLGGALSPLKGVLPEDLSIAALRERVAAGVREVILATNASPDGEATALYLRQELEPLAVRLTRLARGLPSGGQLDYIDAATLKSAIDHRTEF